MVRSLLIMGGIILFLYAPLYSQNIQGVWTWSSQDGQSQFSLDLTHISKDRVSGLHCIENLQARVNECHRTGEDYTVSLVLVAKNIYQGNLLSVRGRTLYTRNIQLQFMPVDGSILFTLTREPEGPLYIPREALLRR